MTNVKKNERYVPLKNYVLAAVIVVAVILLTIYGFAWYKEIKNNDLKQSYLVKEKVISNEINLESVKDVFSEPTAQYFVYISYTGNEEIYNMEKKLKDVIYEYKLNDSFYYLNVTDIKDDKNYIDKINKTFNLEKEKVKNVPTILYCKEGKVVDIINRNDDNIMNVGDFQKLLDINNVTKE